MSAYLHAFGAFVPERVVDNAELAGKLGCTPEWIENACGIRERRWADEGTGIVDLAAQAASQCLAKLSLPQVGLVILASGSARPGFPGPGSALAARLGLGTTPVVDIPMASAGGLFGLALASGLTDVYGDVLVVAADKMSGIIQGHPLDRNTAILFGDGAGAALVSKQPGGWRILNHVLHSDGQFCADLCYDWKSPLFMDGLSVVLQASRKLPAVIKEVLERVKIPVGEISAFLMHQANQNLLNKVAKALGVSPNLIFSNIRRYGNTSSASMLIAAAEWSDQSPAPGPIVFAAFGAGFHWGALVAK